MLLVTGITDGGVIMSDDVDFLNFILKDDLIFDLILFLQWGIQLNFAMTSIILVKNTEYIL